MLAAFWFIIFLFPFSIKNLKMKIKAKYNCAYSFVNLALLHYGKNWWKVWDIGKFVPAGFLAF